MANFYDDNDDLRFYVDQYIDWAPIFELTELAGPSEDGFEDLDQALSFYRGALELVGEFAANEIAPLAPTIDREHHTLVDGVVTAPPAMAGIFEQLNGLMLHGLCVPRELGGMNAPFLLFLLNSELLARADVSVAAHHGFHGGMAGAMLLYSVLEGSSEIDPETRTITRTRFQDYMDEIVAGEAWGCMDITEPGAGSDMAALRCRATQDEQGEWKVSGEKIFITSGHAKYHFVVARTEETDADDAFAGLKGLSMFLVPAWRDGPDGEREILATFTKLEEKLGHHGSATVAIHYEDSPAHLIGERGQGFRMMLMLMNNARVTVGFESLGICEAALRMARAYAAERPSMGKTIDRHEMIADYMDEMATDIQAIRAMAVQAATHEELAQKLELWLRFELFDGPEQVRAAEKRQRQHKRRARHLTPLLKYLGAETAVQHSLRNLQIHGGYGYSSEYGAEKLLRDAMVLPIYEGTSQIQALMAMKDGLMGIIGDVPGFLQKRAAASWRAQAGSGAPRRVARLQLLAFKAQQFLVTRLAGRKLAELRNEPVKEWRSAFERWDPKRDFALAMLHAERLTRILADVAAAELLLEQSERFPERLDVLERWLERAEPRCRRLYREITTTGPRLLATLAQGQEQGETP